MPRHRQFGKDFLSQLSGDLHAIGVDVPRLREQLETLREYLKQEGLEDSPQAIDCAANLLALARLPL